MTENDESKALKDEEDRDMDRDMDPDMDPDMENDEGKGHEAEKDVFKSSSSEAENSERSSPRTFPG